MAEPSSPAAESPSDDRSPAPSVRRRLDRRTVGICVCVALLAALLAGLVTSLVGRDDGKGASDRPAVGTLRKIDPNAPIAVPTDPVERLTTGTFSLADFRGRPVVLNFFSSTCAPCVQEMPELQKLHNALGDKVTFVGIDVQDTKAEGRRLVALTHVSYDIGYDAQANLLRSVEGQVLPTTVLVTPEGRVATVHSAQTTAVELRQLLVDHHLLAPA